jgi:hypothetical protein
VNRTDPVNMTMIDAKVVTGVGKLLTMDSTNNKVDLTAVGEICIGVSAGESERAAGGSYDLTAPTVSMYPLGGVLMVQSAASMTWTTGLTVYATNNGLATTASGSSAKKIGLYVGEGQTTTALVLNGNGDLVGVDGASGTGLLEGNMILVNTAGAEIA